MDRELRDYKTLLLGIFSPELFFLRLELLLAQPSSKLLSHLQEHHNNSDPFVFVAVSTSKRTLWSH